MDQAIQQDAVKTPAEQQVKELTLLQVMGSVFAAGFGVQSKENKVRDFTRGKPIHFIIAGLVFTIGFLGALILVVNMVV